MPHIATGNAARAACTVVAIASLLPLAACEKDGGQGSAPATAAAHEVETHSYQVKGIIESLPAVGPPPTDLRIHHEHIPTFVGNTGSVHVNQNGAPGMRAMTMPFPVIADGVPLADFEVGDKVEFVFAVTWAETEGGMKIPSILVTEISPLPADTEISFTDKPAP